MKTNFGADEAAMGWMGIHKYLSFLIRRPSSGLFMLDSLRASRDAQNYSNAASLFSGKRPELSWLNMFWRKGQRKIFIITLGTQPALIFLWMILKPILKVINNQNVKNYCYYICWRSCYVFCRFHFCLKTQRTETKTIINHFIYLATYAHEKTGKTLARACNRRL